MDGITIPLGTGLCAIVQFAVGTVPHCYSASALNALGWLTIVLLAVAAFGWHVTRRA